MSKRRKQEKPATDPGAARLLGLEEAGDNAAARALARRIAADPEASDEARATARAVRRRLGIDPFAAAIVGGGLVVWALIFMFGVILRH